MISTFILVGLIFSVARYGHLDPPKVRTVAGLSGDDSIWDEDFGADDSSEAVLQKGSLSKSRARSSRATKGLDRVDVADTDGATAIASTATKRDRKSSTKKERRKAIKDRANKAQKKDSNEDDLDLQW
jgi:hypothetical protein